MAFQDVLKTFINKVSLDIQKKKLELEKERNIALGTQIATELYAMLRFNHFYLLKLGVTEDIRLVTFKDDMLTIGMPKVDLFREYDPGDARKVCERLNQLLIKFLQYESVRLGITDYQLLYPNLSKGLRFMSVADHSIEFLVTIKVNL